MKILARSILAFTLLLSTAPAADPPTLQGFSADASTSERAWESKFKTIPSADNLRQYMQRLTAHPHHVGSAYDKANAEWIRDQFRSYGWQADIENFDVLFPTPNERLVEMVSPTKFVATSFTDLKMKAETTNG